MDLPLSDYKKFNQAFEQDVYDVNLNSSVDARNVVGGTAKKRVSESLKFAIQVLAKRR